MAVTEARKGAGLSWTSSLSRGVSRQKWSHRAVARSVQQERGARCHAGSLSMPLEMTNHRILVANHESEALAQLEARLIASGYQVIRASDGMAALERANADAPALAVLDVMMDGISGLEVCRTLKENPKTSRIPVILVSDRQEEVDLVLGFEFGADDYVLKPFSPRELALRIQAILRRTAVGTGEPAAILRMGTVTLDRERRLVTVLEEVAAVTEVEFRLLAILMEHRGRMLTREMLLSSVWPAEKGIEVRTVDTHLRRLRGKLGPAGGYIQTVRGFGYRMEENAAEFAL